MHLAVDAASAGASSREARPSTPARKALATWQRNFRASAGRFRFRFCRGRGGGP